MTASCSKCGIEMVQKIKNRHVCKKCIAKYQREYMRLHRAKNPHLERQRLEKRKQNPEWVEHERRRGREYWSKLRHEAIMAYGGYRCARCGETEPKFLTLDHIFNDGSAHRKEIGNRGSGIFKWLRDHQYPAGFQILCMNCNHGKALNQGICPHKAPYCENEVKTGNAQTG